MQYSLSNRRINRSNQKNKKSQKFFIPRCSSCKEYKDQLKKLDQSFCFFKTTGKDPYVLIGRPGENSLKIVFIKTYDKEKEEIVSITNSNQLEEMIPSRCIENYIDANKTMDHKYVDCDDEKMAKIFKEVMYYIDFLPERNYEGTLLFDEWKANLPMKWVLRNIDDFKGIKNYLTQKFIREEISSPAKKPLLVIEFVNNDASELDDGDRAFIKQYFNEVSHTENEVKKFFDDCQDYLFKAKDQLKSPKYIQESLGEMLYRNFEKFVQEFKTKKVITAVTSSLETLSIANVVKGLISNEADKKKKELASKFNISQLIGVITKVGGVGLAALIIYNIINKHHIKPNRKQRLLQKREEELNKRESKQDETEHTCTDAVEAVIEEAVIEAEASLPITSL